MDVATDLDGRLELEQDGLVDKNVPRLEAEVLDLVLFQVDGLASKSSSTFASTLADFPFTTMPAVLQLPGSRFYKQSIRPRALLARRQYGGKAGSFLELILEAFFIPLVTRDQGLCGSHASFAIPGLFYSSRQRPFLHASSAIDVEA